MIQTAEYVEARVIAILQANLATELTTIYVTEMAGDLTTPTIPSERFYSYELDEGYIPQGPAITVNVKETSDPEVTTTLNSPGVYHAFHATDIVVHVKDAGNEGIAPLKKHMQRIVRGVERVLAIRYPTLPSAGAETVISVKRAGSLTYIATGQEPGQYVRSSRIPFLVETYEYL